MNIRERLKRRGYSLRRGAIEAGIPYMTLHDIATGKTPMEKCSYETLRKLADLLETSVDWIVDETRGTVPIKEMCWDTVETKLSQNNNAAVSSPEHIASREKNNSIAPEAAYFLERPEFLSSSFWFFDDVTQAVPLVPFYDYAVDQFYRDSWVQVSDGLETHQETSTNVRGASEKALVYLENLYFDKRITINGFRFLAYAIAEKIRKDCLFPEYSNIHPDDRSMKYGIFAFYDFLVMCQSLGYPEESNSHTNDSDTGNNVMRDKTDGIRLILSHHQVSSDDVVIRCRPFFIYNGPAIKTIEKFACSRSSNMVHISSDELKIRRSLYEITDDTNEPDMDIWMRRFIEAVQTEDPKLRLEVETDAGERWIIIQDSGKYLEIPFRRS